MGIIVFLRRVNCVSRDLFTEIEFVPVGRHYDSFRQKKIEFFILTHFSQPTSTL